VGLVNESPGHEFPDHDSQDSVRARRARIAYFVAIAQRVGYGALAISIVSFGVGLANSFPDWLVTLSIATLCAAVLVLPVPIVLGYGVKAAEREERRAGF
jgi:hypothetical protein